MAGDVWSLAFYWFGVAGSLNFSQVLLVKVADSNFFLRILC